MPESGVLATGSSGSSGEAGIGADVEQVLLATGRWMRQAAGLVITAGGGQCPPLMTGRLETNLPAGYIYPAGKFVLQ